MLSPLIWPFYWRKGEIHNIINLPVEENVLEVSNSVETQPPVREVNNHGLSEDSHLIYRARAVGMVYESAKQGVDETKDDRRKDSFQINRELKRRGKDYLKLLEIYLHLQQQDQVGSRMILSLLYLHLRWRRWHTNSAVAKFAMSDDWKANAQQICAHGAGPVYFLLTGWPKETGHNKGATCTKSWMAFKRGQNTCQVEKQHQGAYVKSSNFL